MLFDNSIHQNSHAISKQTRNETVKKKCKLTQKYKNWNAQPCFNVTNWTKVKTEEEKNDVPT